MNRSGNVYTNTPANKQQGKDRASPYLLFLLATVCATAVSAKMFYPQKYTSPYETAAVFSGITETVSEPAVLFAEEQTASAAVSAETDSSVLFAETGAGEFSTNNRFGHLPLDGDITSGFSKRDDPFGSGESEFHLGIDISAADDLSVAAWRYGEVTVCEYDESYGNYIVIDHGDGLSSLYAHLAESYVGCGDTVAAGENIAEAGSTGRSTGVHLHFEIRENGEHIDPFGYLYRLFERRADAEA